jgi:hypothetical protein
LSILIQHLESTHPAVVEYRDDLLPVIEGLLQSMLSDHLDRGAVLTETVEKLCTLHNRWSKPESPWVRQEDKTAAIQVAIDFDPPMALLREGLSVYGMQADGTRKLLSTSTSYDDLWGDALRALSGGAQ